MSTVTVNWLLAGPPSPLTPGNTQVVISGGDPGFVPVTMLVAAGILTAVFPNIPAETTAAPYLASATMLDNSASQIAMGTPISIPFSVAAPAANPTPSGISVVVGP
jgi:hypothetical protein